MSYERANIRAMQGYTYGEQPDDANIIKLNTNENPYPPSPQVNATLANFDVSQLRRYPPALATEFRQLAAQRHKVAPDNILVTNGGDEMLRLAITTFVEPGSALGSTLPSYSLYPVLAAVQNAHVLRCPFENGWDLPADFATRMNEGGSQLTCVVNPHAPSGVLFTPQRMAELAEQLDGVLLIDEAYIDFVDPACQHNCVPLVLQHDNVLILRSMSKGYSLAGLRFGYAIGSANLIEPMLTKTRDSYNVDAISQRIAAAAFSDLAYARQGWDNVRAERHRVARELGSLGYHANASQTNFLLARAPTNLSAEDVYQHLRIQKILVRWFDTDELRDCLRITIGLPEENDALLNALALFTTR